MSFCISKDCNLKKDTLRFLYEKYATEESTKIPQVFGGILSNLHYAWFVRKSRIVVVNCKNALRVGSWDFGNTLQDDTAEINKVEEIQRPNGKEPHLIISLNCETRGGMICIFDFVGSKVIRAIQIVDNITSVHVIDRGQDLFSLSGPLRNFDGVLAVGTVGGNVYILDICRQLCYEGFNSFEARDELNPCQMNIITAGNLLDLENYKKIALCSESHLAIFLNVVQNKKTEHFVLKGPGGSDVLYVNKEEVLISALHYCPQLSSILIGYNFGAFQLWDLMNMELVYTSPVCEDHIPIIKFAIQEPADDPRAFCYVWAVYSTEDLESKVLPNLVMYALCFESKEFHENYGVLYENFQYCTLRFQRELGFGNNQSNIKPIGGNCINLDSLVLKNSSTNTEVYGNDGTEDALSLCVVGWKAVCESGQFVYMAVFDLNQWYKAQMPNSSNSDDCSSYMITLCISDLTNTNGENIIEVFDVNLNKKTIQQFIGTQRLEEHYYPSSLSFETSCLLQHKIVNIQYQGVQQALLCQLQRAGPLCLIRPSETYQEIVALGLTPLFMELNTSAINSLNNQREVILSVALEQQLTSWLCKCASEWANGSFSSAGCSLDLLISWAHRRAVTLKTKCDDLCIPLFDYSDIKLDTNTINILSNCIRQIKNISYIFFYILDKFSSYLTNRDTISGLCTRLKMVEVYFDVLQWFFNIGLLPEFTLLDHNIAQEDKVRAPYPVKELEEYYMKRRSELLLAVNKRLSPRKSVLFIDNLISVEFGIHLEKDWKKDGGNGFYPPRSIQALLRTYLLEEMEVCNKHSLIIYLLSDLAVILDSEYQPLITNLMKFPAVFKVSPSFIKITHGFWQLDHGGFHHAMEQLLDPMVNQEDLKNWHHKVALKSLLVQEQHNLALLYMNVRKPPVVDDEDVVCALSLFISNNMLDEAFYLEKNFSNYSSSKNIIKHLFTECSNYGRLHSIIYRNLTHEEEAQFLKYLDEVNHPDAADLKITYFMQRSHYKEAFNTYQACEDDPTKRGLISRLNLKARDQIVHSYKKFLPTVSYEFIESCTREPNPTLWKEVSRPDPMSVCVHKADTKTEYKSSLILAALAKAKLTFNDSVRNVSLLNATTEEIPFLRTPTTASSHKRSSVQVIIPQIVEDEEDEDEIGPSPPKRSKLSFSSPHKTQTEIKSSILTTPIIVRKVRSYVSPIERHAEDVTSTPVSILKVRDSYKTDFKDLSSPTDSSNTPSRTIEHKSLISGRKPTRASIVRFDVPSLSPEEVSSSMRSSARDVRTPERNESTSFDNSSKSVSHSITPKNNSDTDDVFYSPNSSLNNIDELPKDLSSDEKKLTEEPSAEPCLKISPKKPAVVSKAELVKLVDYNPSSSDTSASSPKGRRSYRNGNPVRSSPRLSKSRDSEITEKDRAGSDQTIIPEENISSPSFFSMGRIRKSLNRQVLEANTLARMASVDRVETTRTEIFREGKNISSMVIDDKKTEISHSKIEYSDSYSKESSSPEKISEKHTISTSHSYIAETTLDSDTNESLNKFGDGVEMRDTDSFSTGLEEDLRKRRSRGVVAYRQSADIGNKIELASDVTLVRSSPRRRKGRDSVVAEKDRAGSNQTVINEENILTPSIFSTERRKEKTISSMVVDGTKSEISHTKIEYADSYMKKSSSAEKISEKHSSSTSHSYTAEAILDSDTSESIYKFDDNVEMGVSDSFLAGLEEDLRKRQSRVVAAYRESADKDNKKGNVRERTPLRRRRTSTRISERTLSEQTSENDSVNLEEKRGRVETSKMSLKITTKDDDKSAESIERSPLPKELIGISSFKSSPLHAGSSKKLLLVNCTKKYNRPLSRRVLENNALSRIISEYDTSSNEEMEVDKLEDTSIADDEILENNSQMREEQRDISLSDSVLELIAYGKLNRERELLEKRGKSLMPMEKLEPFDPVQDAVSGGNQFEMKPVKSTMQQNTPSLSDSFIGMIRHPKTAAPVELKIDESSDPGKDQSKDDEVEISAGINTKLEAEKENMSLDEVCSAIYDDLDDEIEQNNSESNRQIGEKESDISVSDSVLELVAFGKLSRERELLEKRGKSLSPLEKLEPFDPVENALSGGSEFENKPDTSTLKQNTPSQSDSFLEMVRHGKTASPVGKQEIDGTFDPGKVQSKDDQAKIVTEAEVEKENMSLVEVCCVIYDDLDDEIEHNNSESNMGEILDDALNQGMLEHSTSGNDSVSKSDQLRPETVTPTAFERNIFDSQYSSDESSSNPDESSKPNMEVIEILSSDESGSKSSTESSNNSRSSRSNDCLDEDVLENDNVNQTNDNIELRHDENNPEMVAEDLCDNVDDEFVSKDALNDAMLDEDSCRGVVASEVSSTMPSVDLMADSNIDEVTSKNNKIESTTEILSQKIKSDENTNSRKNINTKNQSEAEEEMKADQLEPIEDERNKPGRRITRRSSKLLDEQDNAVENKSHPLGENEEVQNKEVPMCSRTRRGSISRRSSQGSKCSEDTSASPSLVNAVPEKPQENPRLISARKRPRSVDTPLNTQMEGDNVTTLKTSEIHRGRRKLRSASVDIPTTIDEELKKESHVVVKSKKKPASISGLDDARREKKGDKKTLGAVKEELVENYKKGRRLTRSQSNILEQSLNKIDLSSLDTQDSIELLDKSEFKGTPDPQEQKVYETSPSSTASAPRSNMRRPARRLSRASSDDSVTSGISTTGRPKSSVTHVDSPKSRVTRRKLKLALEESSDSNSPEQVKDKASDIMTDDSGESDTSIISTRSRKSNTKSDSNKSSKTRKRKIASKSALPEIREENSEVVSGNPAQNTRKGRKHVQK